MNHERIAIVGTAGTWAKTPWTDTGLEILSLNDAYRMKGFARADAWYDLHPLDHFHYPDGNTVLAHTIPPGYYCRPKNHLKWLASQPIPVWLAPEYLIQHPAAKDWPSARPFPKAEIEAAYGRYFTSSPAWMIAHALMLGVRELHIYGIHLATESEYIEQRPNFEFLCGSILGRGKRTITTSEGMRRYATADGMLVLPEAAPVLQSDFQYAFEPRPRQQRDPLNWELHKIDVKTRRAIKSIKARKWYQPLKPLQDELYRLEAMALDTQEQMSRLDAQARLA